MMNSRSLDPTEHELLERAIKKWSPRHLPLMNSIGAKHLSEEEREALRGALAHEMTAAGLREDDEPNSYGIELDDLIGKLAEF